MERRNFLKSVAIAGTAGSLLTACSNAAQPNKTMQTEPYPATTIVHAVYFWLKEGITAEEEKDFLQFFELLKTIPDLLSLQVGKPAATHPRPVVDNSFSYNLIVAFTTLDAVDVYENHPIHLKAIETYSKYWTKVEVRDTIIS